MTTYQGADVGRVIKFNKQDPSETETDRVARADIEEVRSPRPTFTDGEPIAGWQSRRDDDHGGGGAGFVLLVIGGIVAFAGLAYAAFGLGGR